MPAVRGLVHRRRSSLAISFNPIKAGKYGIHSPPPRNVTFAPNVTPGTYVEPELSSPEDPEPLSPNAKLFPPSQLPAPAPVRRRVPPGKRRSLGYIPRPPNAFMLFRADFVRQKHVPGSIETNHGSLSKIIGNCWRALPLEEKRVWEIKAKHAKAEHKQIYPEYRFRPVHNKNKEKKEKPVAAPDDERRCEEVAQLLLEGKKGDELAAAVRSLDSLRTESPNVGPKFQHRRSSSVPLPDHRVGYNGIALPALPFLPMSRSGSPTHDTSMRMMYGQRRASSAQPIPSRSWMMPPPSTLARDNSPLPDVNTSLFDPSFLEGASSFGFNCTTNHEPPFTFGDFLTNLPPNAAGHNDFGMSPLENVAPHEILPHNSVSHVPFSQLQPHPELDPLTWLPIDSTHSDPSSTYSGSPAASESSLPVHAPKPLHPSTAFEVWDHSYPKNGVAVHQQLLHHHQQQQQQEFQHQTEFAQSFDHHGADMTISIDYSRSHPQMCGSEINSLQHYTPALETLFEPSSYGAGNVTSHSMQALDYQFNELVHGYH